jgi:DNA (cytosine-5)-methyltransferase 1
MTHGSLFSGIGGFDLAAEWAGWENMFHCEWNEFGQKILNHYWPNAKSYGDITKTDFSIWRGKIDIITGGFPCQGFSNAGRQLGENDERYLFPEMLRSIREINPRWVVAENVYAIASKKFADVFNEIHTSLENEGYKVQSFVIPASAVGAEHERYRIWIIAYSERVRLSGQGHILGQLQPEKIGDRQTNRFVDFIQRNPMPFMCSSHHGFPRGLAEQAIHGAGNAIVPQVAYQIFKAINEYEYLQTLEKI